MEITKHKSVLLKETIEFLNIRNNGIYIDATVGMGGHSIEILSRLDTGLLLGIDQDSEALEIAEDKLKQTSKKYILVKSNFSQLAEVLKQHSINKVDGVLFDLGVSSFQLQKKERGFSFNLNGALDMRMDSSTALTAYEIVNTYPQQKLQEIFSDYGQERWSKRIAEKINYLRSNKTFETTLDLADAVKGAIPKSCWPDKIHPATKVFQAIRIAVNDEMGNLEKSLNCLSDILNKDARVLVISFHSLEDRIVKKHFNDNSDLYKIITKQPITATEEELNENPRARSAKLRVAERN
ncbi:MAG: 16S rRNA (cytosine(1402)-N(4))-methyltransferase [Elusimicrobia bacterium RIFOXYA2_FULL_39_19]|nr:MAG: 16S rRNA (cytosine(1402)-N(4))-methyltransferase [Elusimicrobia bacterium RIFOXYA2_FULL_39_19]